MSWIYTITSGNPGMTKAQQINNVDEFKNYFNGYMTDAAMAGILGNIQRESFINPGQQQIGSGGSTSSGYGFIQWTPASVLISWCNSRGLNWYDGDAQCYRIKCEGEKKDGAGGYWFGGKLNGTRYNYSWSEFCQLTDYEEACKAYLAQRERAGVSALDKRLEYASNWYNYLHGQVDPPDPEPTPPTPDPRPYDVNINYGGIRDLMRRGVITNGKL